MTVPIQRYNILLKHEQEVRSKRKKGSQQKKKKKQSNNQKQRTRQHKWNNQPTVKRDVRLQEQMHKLFKLLEKEGLLPVKEHAFACKSCVRDKRYKSFDGSTFLGDTGASRHMVPTDEGMFDWREIDEPVVIGDGKQMKAIKIGKVRKTVLQADGTTHDIVLEDVKHVPGLDMPLFAVLKALDQG